MVNKVTIFNLIGGAGADQPGILKTAAMSHPSVASYGTGENHEISPDGNFKAVHVWTEQPITHREAGTYPHSKVREYSIAMLILDKAKEGFSDELRIVSKCDLIAAWIVAYLMENHVSDLTVTGFNVLTLTEYHSDNWAGVRLELTLQTRWPIDGCDPKDAAPE